MPVALPPAVAGDAMADLIELAEFFDVDVDELARPFTLIATDRPSRLEGCEPIEAQAPQNAADGRRRDLRLQRDLPPGVALASMTAQVARVEERSRNPTTPSARNRKGFGLRAGERRPNDVCTRDAAQ
jgi:hypothetical protein